MVVLTIRRRSSWAGICLYIVWGSIGCFLVCMTESVLAIQIVPASSLSMTKECSLSLFRSSPRIVLSGVRAWVRRDFRSIGTGISLIGSDCVCACRLRVRSLSVSGIQVFNLVCACCLRVHSLSISGMCVPIKCSDRSHVFVHFVQRFRSILSVSLNT